jgi:hypothetical protein
MHLFKTMSAVTVLLSVSALLSACGDSALLQADTAKLGAGVQRLEGTPKQLPLTGKNGLLELDGAATQQVPGDDHDEVDPATLDCDQIKKKFEKDVAALFGMVEFHQLMSTEAYTRASDALTAGAEAKCDGMTGLVKKVDPPTCETLNTRLKEAFDALKATPEWQKLHSLQEWTALKVGAQQLKVANCGE